MADALLVTSSFLPGNGGIESYLAGVCDDLAPRLAVLAAHERDGKPLPVDLGYPTIPYPGRLVVPGRAARRAILAALDDLGTDKVLFGTPWPLGLLGPSLARAGVRYAVMVHGAELLMPAAVPALRRWLARSLAHADRTFAVSRFTADHLRTLLRRTGHEPPMVGVLRPRVDLDRFRPDVDPSALRARLGIHPRAKVVLTFGRLVRRKGADRMIAALSEVVRRVPEAIYVVAGTGPESRRLKRLASESGAPVIFTGRIADDDAPACYALADVFVLPVVDRWFGLEVEGLGVVLLEAAACGLPCVTGGSGGTSEAVIDGDTGVVIDATDRDELATAVADLLDKPAAARAMGAAARTHVERNYSRGAPPSLVDWLGDGRTM